MKKKIALALATILALSAMPMTIFAGSSNRISKDVMLVPNESGFYFGNKPILKPGSVDAQTYFADAEERSTLEEESNAAPELVLKAQDELVEGTAFRLKLTNAQWLLTAVVAKSGTTDKISRDIAYNDPELSGTTGNYSFVSMLSASALGYTMSTGTDERYAYTYTAPAGSNRVNYYFKMDEDRPDEAIVRILPDTQNLDGGTADTYEIAKTSVDPTIFVPLTVYMPDENTDVTVSIIDNNSAVSSGTYAFASTKSGSTLNSVRTVKSGREIINLDTLVFKETRTNSIEDDGAFEIIAPQGYEFANTPANWKIQTDNSNGSGFGYELGINGFDSVAYIPTYKQYTESYALYYSGVQQSGQSTSAKIPGSLTISGIRIQPVDDNVVPSGQELFMQTRTFKYDTTTRDSNGAWKIAYEAPGKTAVVPNNAGASQGSKLEELGVAAGSFRVATAVDWKISLKAAGDVPTLIAGRLNETRAEHPDHAAVKVIFTEEELSAWLESRTTTFKLPDGVKIRGIKFNTKTNVTNFPIDVLGRELDAYGSNHNPSKYTAPNGVNYDIDKTKYVDKTGVLTVGENYFSLKDVDRDNEKAKAKLEFTLYLSVEPNYASDEIALTVEGTAVPEEVPPVVIAKVQRPVEIETHTTDVQIGFQNYKVADVTLKETVAGGIKKNDGHLVVGISDYYNDTDVKFAPIKESQFTVEGDLKVTLQKTNDGTITFEVDRPSTTPSTIKMTGLEIKIDRTVPYGKYDLVAYGDAVFANYASAVPASGSGVDPIINKIVGFDTNKDGFVYPAFINVKTEGSNSTLKANVKVQADSTTAIVDGQAVELGLAPINKNGRIMVPLKFMANVFGIEDNNINWYDGNMFNDPGNRVATITSGSTSVQFKIGATTYKQFKNGAEVTKPIDSQGTAAFIDPVSNRIFLPFAAMGEAFDITVKWDEASKTAIYNPSVE